MSRVGMYRNDESSMKGSCWDGMKPTDMRPREEFKTGYLVNCIDRPLLHDGRILKFDCDFRLAKVEWSTGHVGWWYLKDLVVVGWPYSKVKEVVSHGMKDLPEQLWLTMSVQAGL